MLGSPLSLPASDWSRLIFHPFSTLPRNVNKHSGTAPSAIGCENETFFESLQSGTSVNMWQVAAATMFKVRPNPNSPLSAFG